MLQPLIFGGVFFLVEYTSILEGYGIRYSKTASQWKVVWSQCSSVHQRIHTSRHPYPHMHLPSQAFRWWHDIKQICISAPFSHGNLSSTCPNSNLTWLIQFQWAPRFKNCTLLNHVDRLWKVMDRPAGCLRGEKKPVPYGFHETLVV